jgi:serine kinase of HPr protein (carbohydrate metabolism regulator)
MTTGAAVTILHATTIACRHSGQWRGVMVMGPSGAGKSDLTLRAMAAGWRLVSDDRTLVWRSGEGVFGRAPSTLHGLVEARGLGILPVSVRCLAQITLVAACTLDRAAIERMPEEETVNVMGANLPCVRLFALEASALAKLTLALQGSLTAL